MAPALELGTVYGRRDDAGALVGTTVLTRYGASLSVVSMVLVATRCARQGLGRKLMVRALADAGDGAAFLCATELGRPLYEQLGFAVAGTLHTHVGRLSAPPANTTRPAAADLPALVALDAEVTGAARPLLVARLLSFAERVRVVERSGVLTGYAAAWHNLDHIVGPVAAADDAGARALIGDLAGGAGTPVRIDLADRHHELRAWAAHAGLPPRNAAPMMIRGTAALPGDRTRWYGPVMQALD